MVRFDSAAVDPGDVDREDYADTSPDNIPKNSSTITDGLALTTYHDGALRSLDCREGLSPIGNGVHSQNALRHPRSKD